MYIYIYIYIWICINYCDMDTCMYTYICSLFLCCCSSHGVHGLGTLKSSWISECVSTQFCKSNLNLAETIVGYGMLNSSYVPSSGHGSHDIPYSGDGWCQRCMASHEQTAPGKQKEGTRSWQLTSTGGGVNTIVLTFNLAASTSKYARQLRCFSNSVDGVPQDDNCFECEVITLLGSSLDK